MLHVLGLITALSTFQPKTGTNAGLADVFHVATAPMGWNSYDCYNYAVTEKQVMDNAEFMHQKLQKLGWNYVVVDFVWSAPVLGTNVPWQDANFQPHLEMDAYGRLLPNGDRFPSSKNGVGFADLAKRLHKMGLKFGIHLMRGIPRQAVAAGCPIEGETKTGWTARDAADTSSTCSWLNHMYGLNMKTAPNAMTSPGQAYLDSIFRLYARWGVDFVKVDDLSSPYSTAEIEGYRAAIEHSHRPMVLSLSPGETPIDRAEHVSRYADMWRLLGDFWDNWPELDHAFSVAAAWNIVRGRGVWPDLDMLPFGALRKIGPQTGPLNTHSRFTPDEVRTVMTLWCITQSPLMFGGNLPETDADTLAVITNRDVLEMDQRGSGATEVRSGGMTVWLADHRDGRRRYVALFNRTESNQDYSLDASAVGFEKLSAIDLWQPEHKQSGTALKVTLRPHQCALFLVSGPRL